MIITPGPLLKSRPGPWGPRAPWPAAADMMAWSRRWADRHTPATGFAIGFDRLAEIAGLNRNDFIKTPDVYVAALGEKSLSLAFEWISALCLAGIRTEMDFGDKSLKSQMKRANRLGAAHVLIVGENELKQDAVIFGI